MTPIKLRDYMKPTIDPCIICGAGRRIHEGHRCADCGNPLCPNCDCDCDNELAQPDPYETFRDDNEV